MATQQISYKQALTAYLNAAESSGETLQPNRNASEYKNNRWYFRNVNGLLAVVTNGGVVLDKALQRLN